LKCTHHYYIKAYRRKSVSNFSEMYIACVVLEQMNRRAHGFGENSNDY
jgi:hypothetical protein